LAGCGYGWRCQQNSDYQPVGLRFASLPALSSLSQKRNLISLPVLSQKRNLISLPVLMDKYTGFDIDSKKTVGVRLAGVWPDFLAIDSSAKGGLRNIIPALVQFCSAALAQALLAG